MIDRLERRYGLRMEDLDVRADASRFAAPLLVVHDVGDRIVPFDDGNTIARFAPDGRLVSTHGLGHHRVLRAPEVLSAVVPFVADGVRATSSFSETIDGELFFRDRRW
jgi:pimeloyl-ACP methyl ester carboxylesterase